MPRKTRACKSQNRAPNLFGSGGAVVARKVRDLFADVTELVEELRQLGVSFVFRIATEVEVDVGRACGGLLNG